MKDVVQEVDFCILDRLRAGKEVVGHCGDVGWEEGGGDVGDGFWEVLEDVLIRRGDMVSKTILVLVEELIDEEGSGIRLTLSSE